MIYIALAILAYCAYREILWARERRELVRERAQLLQRIQAPEQAIVAASSDGREKRVPVTIAADDDAAFAAAREARE